MGAGREKLKKLLIRNKALLTLLAESRDWYEQGGKEVYLLYCKEADTNPIDDQVMTYVSLFIRSEVEHISHLRGLNRARRIDSFWSKYFGKV